jgi:fibronectin type 3 domain-containing protein
LNLNLGEKIVFSWSSDGDSQTKYTIYKKEIHSNEWSVLFEVKGVNSKVYEIKDFIGSYQFKIVSGNQELISSQIVKINGDLLIFNYDEFYPKGEFIKDGKSIRLKWSDNSKEILNYEVWVRTIDDDNFKKIAVTSNRFFDYILEQDRIFRWKIVTNYKDKYVESNEIEANPTKLLTPQIDSIELYEAFIKINFTEIKNAKKYQIYRSTCDGIYKVIGEVETNYYQDYDLQDRVCFSYKIVAIANDNIMSNFSNEKSINIGEGEIYNVIVENKNSLLINDNKIVLSYHPDRKVSFEKYEILIGRDPKNLATYLITDKRNITIEDLAYSTTYYIEIYPLDIRGKRLNIIPARLTFSTGFDNRKVTQKPTVTIDEVSDNYIVLSWSEVSNSDDYEIYRSEDGKSFEYLYKTNDTKFIDNINIESSTVYYYKIKALNSNSFSISDSVEVKTVKNNQECIQVITHAYNPKTGEEKDFSTPCDIPDGWIRGEAPDNDGDGINDIKDTDDDNDGISDADEVKYNLNPKDPSDANQDSDGDGISNIDEIRAGMDPLHKNIMISIKPITNLYLSPNTYIPPIVVEANSSDGSTLEYSVTSSNPDVVVASISGNVLTLTLMNDAEGSAKITVTATTGSSTKDTSFYVNVKRTMIELEDSVTADYVPLEASRYDIETDNLEMHTEVIDDKHLFYQLKKADENTTVKVVIPGAKVKVSHDYTTTISLPTPKEANITISTDGKVVPKIPEALLPKDALPLGTEIEVNETKVRFRVPMPERLEF